ncbi:MAG TPA: hypothetical protein VGG61_02670, partial [Gemmataceae bacterium]
MSTDPAASNPESSSIGTGPARPADSSIAMASAVGSLAADPTVTLPPPTVVGERRVVNPERVARTIRRIDLFFVGAILVLAFLLGSFLARNTDIWMHIATGRALRQGTYHFGVDPFSSTMDGTYWVNHAWLFDVAAFGVYENLGGAGLVVLKALLIVALAVVLMRLAYIDGSVWMPAVFTGLTLLVISARLALQPVCVSYLFLALTLWLLERPQRRADAARENEDRGGVNVVMDYWLLALLFILWVNLDDWFILGPITVALYTLGQVLQARLAPAKTKPLASSGRIKGLLIALVVGLAACLLNPHHIRAFVPPAQLGLSESAYVLREDPSIRNLFVSPFDPSQLRLLLTSVQVAGWLYLVLVVLGILSFLLGLVSFLRNRVAWSWWRFVIWSAFFLLSAYQARTIPFFAVVAGPITALNFQEYLARLFGRDSAREAPAWWWAVYGRLLTGVVLVLLLILAWPGWLQPQPHERRAWAVAPDPSLERAAAQIAAWRRDGKLGPEARGFNLSPETANYF